MNKNIEAVIEIILNDFAMDLLQTLYIHLGCQLDTKPGLPYRYNYTLRTHYSIDTCRGSISSPSRDGLRFPHQPKKLVLEIGRGGVDCHLGFDLEPELVGPEKPLQPFQAAIGVG